MRSILESMSPHAGRRRSRRLAKLPAVSVNLRTSGWKTTGIRNARCAASRASDAEPGSKSQRYTPTVVRGMRVVIKPRVQKDKWSLYWKTSMVTRTETLDEFALEVDPGTTAKELKARVASELGWPPVEQLLRLEGFVEPWELCCCKGIELEESSTLSASGIKDNDEIVTVRKVLVAEGAFLSHLSFAPGYKGPQPVLPEACLVTYIVATCRNTGIVAFARRTVG